MNLRIVGIRNLQNALRSLETAVAQFANFRPKPYPGSNRNHNPNPKADDTPDFCCATLLRNLLRNKVARSATMQNAAATKRATNVASSDTDDDV